MLLLFLAFDLAVLCLVLGFFLGGDDLVLLILLFQTFLGVFVDVAPHLTDDFGDFGDFGFGVLGLDLFVYFTAIEEKC